jgi:adenylate cyclase
MTPIVTARRSRDAMVRRTRLVSGLVLFSYIATHLTNHALGLAGIDAMEAGRKVFLAVWRNPVGSSALYGALTTHFCLALWSLFQRRQLRMPAWEASQLLLGLLIPALLTMHAVGNRLAFEWYGTVDSYTRLLIIYWSRPVNGWNQALLLLIAWTHGCIGLHFWLRLKPWYPRAAQFLAALALLVPLLALLGYVEALREIAELVQRPGWVRDTLAASKQPDAAGLVALGKVTDAVLTGYAASLALTLLLRWLRNLHERHRNSIRIAYPGGREVVVPVGYSVLEASRFAGFAHASVCGGRGRCSTCRVRVERGREMLPEASADDLLVLKRVGAAPGVRLACQLRPSRDVSVVPLLAPDATARDGHAQPGYIAGQELEICVLFADLRGFTRFAERKLPYDVVFFLNRYFEMAGSAIEGTGGIANQFVGDGVMALFGVESGPEQGCRDALAAARALVRGVAEMNSIFGDELAAPLAIGVGIHTGAAVVGHMGRGVATYLTAVGDTVNTTARLQDLTKQYSCELIVSEIAAGRAGFDVSTFPRHDLVVRNRTEPIAMRAIEDVETLALPWLACAVRAA